MVRCFLVTSYWQELLQLVCLIAVQHTCLTDNPDGYVRDYEEVSLQTMHRDKSRKEIELSFSAFGRRFELLLRRSNRLFHSDMRVHVVSDHGIKEEQFDSSRYYVGNVKDAGESVVHGYLSEEYGFDGVIHLTEETYHVEPAHRFSPTGKGSLSVVYRLSDLVYNETVRFVCPGKHTTSSSLRVVNDPLLRTIRSSMFAQSRFRRARKFNSDMSTCRLVVVADYEFFIGPGEANTAATIAEMSFHVQQANTIFRNTEFDDIQNIGFRIDKTIIYTTADNPLYGSFQVDELLDTFSELDFSDFCLAHLFTNQDFQNGVIGLAWVGDTSSGSGGLCETERVNTRNGDRSLNTGFTTVLNYNRKVPRAVSTITTTHELGHNFGSLHDEATEECTPGEFGNSNGNYIMFASATDGSKTNNKQFSPCSKPTMADVIRAKGGCLVAENPDPQCGNGVVEGDEECDCGSSNPDVCKAADPCCKPGNCTLIEGAKCSPVAKTCCSLTCEFSTVLCRQQEECIYQTFCNGMSGDCPDPVYWEDNTICNDGANTCINGQCTGSICPVWNADNCICSLEEQLCHVCCMWDGVCMSTFDRHESDEKVNGSFIPAGTACNDFKGYCDDTGKCKTVDNQSPLDDLNSFLTTISLNSIATWLKQNWQYAVGGFTGMILLLVLFHIVYKRRGSDEDNEESQTLLSDQDRQKLADSAEMDT